MREIVPGVLVDANGHLHADKNNTAATVGVISKLLKAADDAELLALASTESKARGLRQNARAARNDARRLEKTLAWVKS